MLSTSGLDRGRQIAPAGFYANSYGITSDVETFRRIAREMKSRQVPLTDPFMELVKVCRRLNVMLPGPPI